jgi:hypothetical protein
MSAGNYPNEFLSIFNSANFNATNGSDTLTQEQADLLYLKYPFGQGSETIPSLIVGDNAGVGENLRVGQNILMSGSPLLNFLQFPDGTQQFTASTGGGSGSSVIYSNFTNINNPLTSGTSIYPYQSSLPDLSAGIYQFNLNYNINSKGGASINSIVLSLVYIPSGVGGLSASQEDLVTAQNILAGQNLYGNSSITIYTTGGLSSYYIYPIFGGADLTINFISFTIVKL